MVNRQQAINNCLLRAVLSIVTRLSFSVFQHITFIKKVPRERDFDFLCFAAFTIYQVGDHFF